jgi:Lipase (class 3)
MASIGAYIIQAAPYNIRIEQVVTFASPKPGDGAFQAAYQKIFPAQIRYENYDDLVPLLPPADDLTRAVVDIPLIGRPGRFRCPSADGDAEGGEVIFGAGSHMERPS